MDLVKKGVSSKIIKRRAAGPGSKVGSVQTREAVESVPSSISQPKVVEPSDCAPKEAANQTREAVESVPSSSGQPKEVVSIEDLGPVDGSGQVGRESSLRKEYLLIEPILKVDNIVVEDKLLKNLNIDKVDVGYDDSKSHKLSNIPKCVVLKELDFPSQIQAKYRCKIVGSKKHKKDIFIKLNLLLI